MLLTETESVKTYLGLTTNTNDALLNHLISGVSAVIASMIGIRISENEYVDKIRSWGFNDIYLTHGPVIEVKSVLEGSTPLDSSSYSLVHKHTLRRLNNGRIASWALDDVTVTYRAGYADVPADLSYACMVQVAFEYRQTKPGGDRIGLSANSPATQGESVSFTPHDLLPAVRRIVELHRPL